MSGEAKIHLFIYIHPTECLSQVQGVLLAFRELSSLAEDGWTDDIQGLESEILIAITGLCLLSVRYWPPECKL